MQNKTHQAGARIEMLAVGSLSEAYRIGRYWADKLAHGAAIKGISVAVHNHGWKVIIQYRRKPLPTQGSDHENTLS